MTRRPTRRFLLLLAGLVLTGRPVGAAPAVELLYVREAGCPWCREWDSRIGPVWGKTAEARRAPLREIEKRDVDKVGVRLMRPIRYTPTFVLAVDGTEIGRIEGYPGEDFFWGRLDALLEKLPAE